MSKPLFYARDPNILIYLLDYYSRTLYQNGKKEIDNKYTDIMYFYIKLQMY